MLLPYLAKWLNDYSHPNTAHFVQESLHRPRKMLGTKSSNGRDIRLMRRHDSIKAGLVIGPWSQWAQVTCYGKWVWKVRCHLNDMSKFMILALQYVKWIQRECLAHLIVPLDTEGCHKFKEGKGRCSLQKSVTQAIVGQLLCNVIATPMDTILFEIYVSNQGEYIRNLHCSRHCSSVRREVSHLEWGGPHAPKHLQCRSPQHHSNARSAKSYLSVSLIDTEM